MFHFAFSVNSIGLEWTPSGLKGTTLKIHKNSPSLIHLFTLHPDIDSAKPLGKHYPIITTGLEGTDVMIRPMILPLKKDKDLAAALAFQAEPLLPYPLDQALLTYQTVSKTQEETSLTLLAVRQEAVQTHLEQWHTLHIDPEKVSCVPSALCQFGAAYLSSTKTYVIAHVQQETLTCVLIKEGKLLASFAQREGLNLLINAQTGENPHPLPQTEWEWQTLEQQKNLPLEEALGRLQKGIAKMSYALLKELKGEAIDGIAITGEAADWKGLNSALTQPLHLPLLTCEQAGEYSPQQLLSYAVPIGLAIGSLPNQRHPIDFRQQEWSYPHPWQRLRTPLIAYFAAILLLTCSFYFFSQSYLRYQETQLKQNYVDLLASINKSHAQFEKSYLTKNGKSSESFNDEGIKIEQLSQENLTERLNFLQKDIQATPDSFPLFANIPRVSDVLAWLSQHPAVSYPDDQGQVQTRLQIENFDYTMIKRPQQGKKQEKYQVKIELEFSSPTPKWAREFHDALIAPNDWVDPKGEVKWSSNRGKYKTSFFLKDKTIYPSSS